MPETTTNNETRLALHEQKLAIHEQQLNSQGKRIEKTEGTFFDIRTGITALTGSTERFVIEQANTNAKIDKLTDSMERSFKSQGERIGDMEHLSVKYVDLETRLIKLEKSNEEQKGKGSKLWNKTVEKIFYIVAMIILYVILGQLGL